MKRKNKYVSSKTTFSDGKTYQWIADNYGKELGLNHPSSVRKVYLDAIEKLARHVIEEMYPEWDLSEEQIKNLAASEYFQTYIADALNDEAYHERLKWAIINT